MVEKSKICPYVAVTILAQQLFSTDLSGSLLEVIISIRRPIYTDLYELIFMIKITVLFFYVLICLYMSI